MSRSLKTPFESEDINQSSLNGEAGFSSLLEQAAILLKQKKCIEALEIYDNALEIKANNHILHNNRGAALKELGRLEEALGSFDLAIKCKPAFLEAQFNRANTLKKLNRLEEAIGGYDAVIRIKPDHATSLNNKANTLKSLGRMEEALISYDHAIQIQPDYFITHNNRGATLKDSGRLDEALESFDLAIKYKPDFVDALFHRANTLKMLNRLEEAISGYDAVLHLKSNHISALNNKANSLNGLGRAEEALASYDEAIKLKPDYVDALYNRANILKSLGRLEEALVSFDAALKLRPKHTNALNNRANIFVDLGRLEEALASYDEAIKLKPDYVDAIYNRANTLKSLGRLEEALSGFDAALALKSDHTSALNNKANTLNDLGRLEEALSSFAEAIKYKPDFVDALGNQANTLKNLGRLDEALANYEAVLSLEPNRNYVHGLSLHMRMSMCDWSNFESSKSEIIRKISAKELAIPPFPFLSIDGDSKMHQICSELYTLARAPYKDTLGPIQKRAKTNKIRVGYYSSDFNNHAVSYLIADLFEVHDKTNFEITAFSFGPDKRDELRKRLSKAFDHFIDVRRKSNIEIAKLSRDLKIDIAIDLNGFTSHSRTPIFSYRAAPIQINYLGFPSTMGAEYIDYVIADHTLISTTSKKYFTEKIIYLPNSYQPNDRKRSVSEKRFTRAELGLPESAFVFCCFNNSFKITPKTFDSWMRILTAVDGSVLWLLEPNRWASENLKKEAKKRGVNPERLVFAKKMRSNEHLSRHRLADLFIDTLPYNAHTTCSDALWVGLPVLTLMGESFAGRVASSLLKAVGLPELITATQADYEALAIELATNPAKLNVIKEKLSRNHLSHPLFDTSLFARHIEDAYRRIMDRYWNDLPPADISIR